jgi:anaerobic ribonucleoside-triphosphate reductase activating protein
MLDESIVDGPGVRFVVFAQGCLHHCPGCHNPATWDVDGGEEYSVKEVLKRLKKRKKFIHGLTLSGGEPFLQAKEMAELARAARGLELSVVTYTGYLYEDLLTTGLPGAADLLAVTDFLIDGPFIAALKDITLPFRGSANQCIIDLTEQRTCGVTYQIEQVPMEGPVALA